MRKFITLWIVSLISLTCCIHNQDIPGNDTDTAENTRFNASEQSDIEFADMIFEKAFGKTRAVTNAKSVEVFLRNRTRTNCTETTSDTLFSIVNYMDERGFVMIGKDCGNRILYALSDEGHLNLADTLANPGLAIYIKGLRHALDNPLKPDMEPAVSLVSTIDPEITTYTPMLNANVRLWDQGDPFNSEIAFMGNSPIRPKVGCIPLAMGMVMTFFEWPNRYSYKTDTPASFNWSIIKEADIFNIYGHQSGFHHIAILLDKLRNGYNLNTTLSGEESITDNKKVKDTFCHFEYNVNGDWEASINYANLMGTKPIMAGGKETHINNATGIEETRGHCWILDGLITIKWIENVNSEEREVWEYYPHCVWGIGGLNNGYYLFHRHGQSVYKSDWGSPATSVVYKDLLYYSGYSKPI